MTCPSASAVVFYPPVALFYSFFSFLDFFAISIDESKLLLQSPPEPRPVHDLFESNLEVNLAPANPSETGPHTNKKNCVAATIYLIYVLADVLRNEFNPYVQLTVIMHCEGALIQKENKPMFHVDQS